MTNRRQTLKALGALAVSSSTRSAFSLHSPGHNPKTAPEIHFGAQTNAWAIDPHDFSTFLSVLKQVRQIGYTGFETGFGNVMNHFATAAESRRKIEKTGLTFFGVHIYLPSKLYDPSTNLPPAPLYEKVAVGGLALGARHLIFSAAPAQTTEELDRKIAGLNAAGRYSKSIGLQLAYHNETTEESSSRLGELSALYARTNPEYVSFLLDCGHAYQGGTDVPAFLQEHYRRIVGLHLRDYRNGEQVVLGNGTFPLEASAEILKHAHWKGWILNEEERLDGSKHGSEYMKPAFKTMQEAFSV